MKRTPHTDVFNTSGKTIELELTMIGNGYGYIFKQVRSDIEYLINNLGFQDEIKIVVDEDGKYFYLFINDNGVEKKISVSAEIIGEIDEYVGSVDNNGGVVLNTFNNILNVFDDNSNSVLEKFLKFYVVSNFFEYTKRLSKSTKIESMFHVVSDNGDVYVEMVYSTIINDYIEKIDYRQNYVIRIQ